MTQNDKQQPGELPTEAELAAFMKEAMAEARLGQSEGGIPIGSVLVRAGKIIGRGHNRRIQNNDPTAHAEIECLRDVGRIGNYANSVLYSTLMPCAMCAGASVLFRIPVVVAGENRTFHSSRHIMEAAGTKVIDLDLDESFEMLRDFVLKHPNLWNEDIGLS